VTVTAQVGRIRQPSLWGEVVGAARATGTRESMQQPHVIRARHVEARSVRGEEGHARESTQAALRRLSRGSGQWLHPSMRCQQAVSWPDTPLAAGRAWVPGCRARAQAFAVFSRDRSRRDGCMPLTCQNDGTAPGQAGGLMSALYIHSLRTVRRSVCSPRARICCNSLVPNLAVA
jgi:hypothetical protein